MSAITDLSGKTALITGASSGIGAASAHRLAAEGVDIALTARSAGRLTSIADELEAEHNITALALGIDVRNHSEVQETVSVTVEEFDGLDIVLNNAGISRDEADISDMALDDYNAMIETNINGMFYTTRETLPHLRSSNGNLIFLGSSAGNLPRPAAPVYSSTKWWTRGFALSIEARFGDEGVGVSVIHPTAVRTEFAMSDDEAMRDAYDPGNAAEPEEVADAVMFAAKQPDHLTVSELQLYRRDVLGKFIPANIDD